MNKKDLITAVRSVLERHPYVLRAELFGSQRRGDATPLSDVDLLVQFDQEVRPKGVNIYAVELELEETLGRPVEVVQEKLLRDNIRQAISSDRELIYEKYP
ncbi:MAG: nucleotidyltransferase domain-containing protein [Candidatus Adiutrix sp.]|jgi:predicted nucleotidyltransferase|nr:nucleotidyltransferase domain-containing protein [Candidatus Adiutrix sp.]